MSEVDELLLASPKYYNKELKYRDKRIEDKLLQCYPEEIVDIIVKLIRNGNRVDHRFRKHNCVGMTKDMITRYFDSALGTYFGICHK